MKKEMKTERSRRQPEAGRTQGSSRRRSLPGPREARDAFNTIVIRSAELRQLLRPGAPVRQVWLWEELNNALLKLSIALDEANEEALEGNTPVEQRP
jgi:hypothetical protein